MTSMPSNERENSIRREVAFRLEQILRSSSSFNKWLPVYEIEINSPEVRTFLFVPLDIKKKGKKRIYTTRGAFPSQNDLFISYMSRKDLRRMDNRLGPKDRELLRRQRRMVSSPTNGFLLKVNQRLRSKCSTNCGNDSGLLKSIRRKLTIRRKVMLETGIP